MKNTREKDIYNTPFELTMDNFKCKFRDVIDDIIKNRTQNSIKDLYIRFKGRKEYDCYIKIIIINQMTNINFLSYINNKLNGKDVFEDNNFEIFVNSCHIDFRNYKDIDKENAITSFIQDHDMVIDFFIKKFWVKEFLFELENADDSYKRDEFETIVINDEGDVNTAIYDPIDYVMRQFIHMDGFSKNCSHDIHSTLEIECELSSLDNLKTKGRIAFNIIHMVGSDIVCLETIPMPYKDEEHDRDDEPLSNMFCYSKSYSLSNNICRYIHDADSFGKDIKSQTDINCIRLLEEYVEMVTKDIEDIIKSLTNNHNIKTKLEMEVI